MLVPSALIWHIIALLEASQHPQGLRLVLLWAGVEVFNKEYLAFECLGLNGWLAGSDKSSLLMKAHWACYCLSVEWNWMGKGLRGWNWSNIELLLLALEIRGVKHCYCLVNLYFLWFHLLHIFVVGCEIFLNKIFRFSTHIPTILKVTNWQQL